MLHRYVMIVATTPDAAGFIALRARLSGALEGWNRVLDTTRAAAWVIGAPTSQLGARPLGPTGCVIGRDFETGAADLDTLLARSWGAYVAVATDPRDGAVTVLRDPTGRLDCWRLRLAGADVLFSHLGDVHRLQARPSPINWDYLAHHLRQELLHGHDTGLTDIDELLPGEALDYTGGPPSRRTAWRPHAIAADSHPHIEAAGAAMRRAGETVVTAWARGYRRIALDLSGGLDSAIVLGLLRRHAGHPDVLGVNRVTPGEEGDERRYAREAAAMHGIAFVEQSPLSHDRDFSTRFPRRLMRPRARVLPLGYDEAGAEIARRFEADAFFTGTGGDHLFYDHLPIAAACDAWRHHRRLGGFVGTAIELAQLSKDTVWAVCGEALQHQFGGRQALAPVRRVRNRFLAGDAPRPATDGRHEHPWITAAGDAPPAKLLQIVNLIELQRHYYRYGRADAAEETHPLFSQPLVEACLRTPSHWFGMGGIQRGLARSAFRDLVPASILNRRTKGGNTPYLVQFMHDRLPRVRELLLNGRLMGQGLLDRAVVEQALTPLQVSAAKDFHSIIVCLSTELWVRQAEADRDEAANRPRAMLVPA